jgi:hypothetical protein
MSYKKQKGRKCENAVKIISDHIRIFSIVQF